MKSRMTALDVRAMVSSIKKDVTGLRLVNVYDMNKKVYVLKLSRGDIKEHFVIESGIRFHTSEYKRNKNDMPSFFTMKLRKALRGKVLRSVSQLGVDRVIRLEFGVRNPVFLFVEFYVLGNIILTDENYKINLILRNVNQKTDSQDATGVSSVHQLTVGSIYPMNEFCSPLKLSPILQSITENRSQEISTFLNTELNNFRSKFELDHPIETELPIVSQKSKQKKSKDSKSQSMSASTLLTRLVPFAHLGLAEIVLKSSGGDSDIKDIDDKLILRLLNGAKEILDILRKMSCPGDLGGPGGTVSDASMLADADDEEQAPSEDDEPTADETAKTTTTFSGVTPLWQQYRAAIQQPEGLKGYATYFSKPTEVAGQDSESTGLDYDDFGPSIDTILIKESTADRRVNIKEFETFSKCVDDFYSRMDVLRVEKIKNVKAHQLNQRLEKIKTDQFKRVADLQSQHMAAERDAKLVETHHEFVDRAIFMVKKLKATGGDWKVIDAEIRRQRSRGHPIAMHIISTDFSRDMFTLLIASSEEKKIQEETNDVDVDLDVDMVPVPIVIGMNAYSNAARLHSVKKASKTKYERTEEKTKDVLSKTSKASAKALESFNTNVDAARPTIKRLRKVFWFEKFYWFISSEQYLIVAGRDAIQNDLLYRKYLTKNDIYVHADTIGAASCIIRNPDPSTPVPPLTIQEAGIMSVCRSKSWNDNILVPAYWVYAHQVSKTPQAGEYIRTGGFIIRGKRNLIIVHKLEVGIGMMFHLGDEKSIQRFITARQSRAIIYEDNEIKLEDKDKDKKTIGTEEELSSEELSESSSSEDENDQQKEFGNKIQSNGKVQFGSSEVFPTEVLDHRVDFENLPPEVISHRSAYSESESESSSSSESENLKNNILNLNDIIELSSKEDKKGSVFLLRGDSADEAAPPPEYVAVTSTRTRDLLQHTTPESREALLLESVTGEDNNSPAPGVKSGSIGGRVDMKTKLCHRMKSVDGGPNPRGFFEDEVPLPKDLLSSSLHGKRNFEFNISRSEEHMRTEPGDVEKETESFLGDKEEIKTQTTQKGAGRLSKAARRKLKKGTLKLEEEIKSESVSEVEKKNEQKLSDEQTATATLENLNIGVVSRGKKSKIKKMKKKYGEQSDEERELAMKLMGAKHVKELTPVVPEDESKKKVSQPVTPTEIKPFEDRNLLEEDDDEIINAATWETSATDQLCGDPDESDCILSAVPMVAPLSALSQVKYKARLTPGGSKKGRVAQNLLTVFQAQAPKDSAVRQLLRQCEIDEITGCLVANPTVHLPQINKLVKKQKMEKKKAKKMINQATAQLAAFS